MQSERLYGINFCTNSSVLTATGGETVHDSTVLMNFCIGGKAYSKSGTNADQTTPTLDYNTGVAFPGLVGVASAGGQGAAVVWAYDSSGNVNCMMGPVQALDAAGTFLLAPEFASVPDDVCPFAYTIEKHYGQASTWTFGTSNWNVSGHTHVIVNLMTLPDRPQVS